MPESDIQSWLRKARQAGFSDAQIRERLRSFGWAEPNIEAVFKTPPPSSPTTPNSSIIFKPEPSTSSIKPKHKLRLLVWSLALVFVLLGGAVAASYFFDFPPIPFLSKNADSTLLKSFQALAETNGGEFGFTFHIVGEPRSTDAKPFKFEKIAGESEQEKRSKDSTTRTEVAALRYALLNYFQEKKVYPDTLEVLSPQYRSMKQGNGEPIGYVPSADKQHFTLTFQYLAGDTAGSQTASDTAPPPELAEGSSDLSTVLSPNTVDSFIEFIPSDLDFTGKLTAFTTTGVTDEKAAKGIITLQGSYKTGGTTLSLNLELRRKDGKYYLQVQEFPNILFIDLSPFKDKWIAIDPDAEGEDAFGFIDPESIKGVVPNKDKTTKLRSELPHVLRVAFSTKVIVAKFDGRETIDGRPARRIRVEINPDQLPSFSDAYRADASQRGVDLQEADELLTNLKKPELIAQAKEFLKNMSVTIWVDPVRPTPRKIEIGFIIVPSDRLEKFKDRQFRTSFGLTFNHLGDQPSVQIPDNPVPLEEASRILSGQTVEEQKFEKQRSAIDDIRSALSNFKQKNQTYPSTLDELLQEPPANENSGYDLGGKGYFLTRKSIPNDVLSGQPFEYAKTDSGYTLTYTMHLPPVEEEGESPFGSISNYYRDQYIEGTNTANETKVSVEAATRQGSSDQPLSNQGKLKIENLDEDVRAVIPVTAEDHIRGPQYAAVTLVEFGDVESPACGQFHTDLKKIVQDNDGKVRWVFKHFPLDAIHPNARRAAEASECAADQGKFWEFLDAVCAAPEKLSSDELNQTATNLGLNANTFNSCLSTRKYQQRVQNEYQYGISIGVTGSPSSFTNGKPINGGVPLSQLQSRINEELARTGNDFDGDGLSDLVESSLGTSSSKSDSDGDGYSDGVEVSTGHDPLKAGL